MITNNAINKKRPVPLVSAYYPAPINNTTGDGSEYILSYSERIDSCSNFDGTNFVASEDGLYWIIFSSIIISITTGSHTIAKFSVGNSTNKFVKTINPSALVSSNGNCGGRVYAIMPMSIGDSINSTITVYGGTKTITVNGSSVNIQTSLQIYKLTF